MQNRKAVVTRAVKIQKSKQGMLRGESLNIFWVIPVKQLHIRAFNTKLPEDRAENRPRRGTKRKGKKSQKFSALQYSILNYMRTPVGSWESLTHLMAQLPQNHNLP